MNKHRVKGYSLLEFAIVLVVVGLLITGFTAGFSHYRDRAEFIGSERNSELEELIAMDKRIPANQVTPELVPELVPEVVPEPEVAPDPEVENDADDGRSWDRFWAWLRDRRRNRS